MPRAPYFLLVFFFSLFACGSEEEAQKAPPIPTPYGNAQDVTNYLTAINPHVRGVSQIQQQVDQNVGTTGQATGKNLAAAMQEVYPALEEHQNALSAIKAPAELGSLHADILHLVKLRLEAYSTTIKGWQQEEQNGDLSLYPQAQERLNEANTLIVELNRQMQTINTALLQATQTATQVASP